MEKQALSKEEAKKLLPQILQKYQRFKESGGLESEGTVELLIQELFTKVLGWESVDDYVSKVTEKNRKIPDYTFRINGINKFFLEAKRASDSLDNLQYQKQVIGYARSSAVTFAVLTNLLELRIYVVDREIEKFTHYEKALLFPPLRLEDCLQDKEFDKLWFLSKESFLQGLIYKEAEERCKLPKRTDINTQLSDKLNFLRQKIIKSINDNEKKNANLFSQANAKILLQEATQKLLDRMVFIRVCEDREYENKNLEALYNAYNDGKEKNLWQSIKSIFRNYEGKYDSSLFEMSLCDNIFVDDKVIALVIEELLYFEDKSPINFQRIPADVLGNLYESYLSHISKSAEKQKSHRKEQGIYYTPTYITEYIVRNSLGKILEQKKVDVEKIKILDMACGSGSFLIKAYDVLEEHYMRNIDKHGQTALAGDKATYSLKERILKNNIFGVDLDKQAVEIAQLNLVLKIATQGEKLPLLKQNIKLGNSLFNDKKYGGEAAFDWHTSFKEIMDAKGFDAIIGNPPYVDIKGMLPEQVRGLFANYQTPENRINLYSIFVERTLQLLKDGGYFGFIIPNSILYNSSYTKIRKKLLQETNILSIVRLPDNTFADAKVETIILTFKKKDGKKIQPTEVLIYGKDDTIDSISKTNTKKHYSVNQEEWLKNEGFIFNIFTDDSSTKLLQNIEKDTKKLIDVCDFSLGITPYDKYKGHTQAQIQARAFHATEQKAKDYKKLLSGGDITRYGVFCSGKEWIRYGNWLGAPREQRFFNKEHIVIRQIVSGTPLRIYAGYCDEELYNTQIAFNLLPKDESKIKLKYVLAILNSKLMNFYHTEKFLDKSKRLFQKILIQNAKMFPIQVASLDQQKKVIELVDAIIETNKKIHKIGDLHTDEIKKLKDERDRIDTEIDKKIYEIYGLTKSEQEIIEKNFQK